MLPVPLSLALLPRHAWAERLSLCLRLQQRKVGIGGLHAKERPASEGTAASTVSASMTPEMMLQQNNFHPFVELADTGFRPEISTLGFENCCSL